MELTRRDVLKAAASMSALGSAAGRGSAAGVRWDRYYLGSAYYPEQWDASRWEDDFRKMADLGLSAVRMGEFAWAFFEPAPGKFRFDWMDRAIELAERHRIAVLLCTPTASVPPWLRKLHPDVLGANENGPFTYGGRKGYNTESPAFLEAVDRVVTAMAAHYGGHPGVAAWQIDNEPGYPFMNYDAHALAGFRRFLKQRYGTLARLNQAWDGAFWSNYFTDWDEIEIPYNSAEGGWQPGIKLDYRRFFADSFFRYVERQSKIVRQYAKNQFIYTNWPNTRWSVDLFRAAGVLDATAWDNYVRMPGAGDYRAQFESGMNHDLSRCAGPNGRFLVAEQSTQAPANGRPEGIRVQTMLDFAHGAGGTLFFEWRPPLGGNEQGTTSVLRLDGSFGPAEQQYRRMGKEFGRLGPMLAGAVTESDLAMIYSYDNQWAQGFWNKSAHEGYDVSFQRYYDGVKALRRNIDIVPPSASLSRYRMVVAPNLRMVSDETATRLAAYVRQGGILVLNSRAGTLDLDNKFRESIGPGPFTEIAGVRVSATARGLEGAELVFGSEGPAFASNGSERLELHAAQPLATFRGGWLNGRAAVTVNASGKGHVVYLGTESPDPAFFDRLAQALGERFHITPLLAAPPAVEVVSRRLGSREYVFLVNLTADQQTVPLPSAMDELITEARLEGNLAIPPLEVRIVVRPASS